MYSRTDADRIIYMQHWEIMTNSLVVVHARVCSIVYMLKNDGPFTQTTAAAWLSTVYIYMLTFFFFFFHFGFSIFIFGSNPNVLVSNQSREASTVVSFLRSHHPTYASLYILFVWNKKKKKGAVDPRCRDDISDWTATAHTHSTQYKREKKTFRKKYYPFLFCFVLFLFFSFYSIVFSQSSIFINAILCWETERCPTYIIRYMFTSLIFLFLCPLTYMRQRRGGGHCPFSLVIFILSDENINKQ